MTQSQPPGAPSSDNGETRDDGAQVLPIDPSVVRAAVRNGMRRYAESRRAGIPEFVGRNFGLAGAVELHGRALGWDLLRAPANMALSLPYVGLQAAAAVGRGVGLRRAGDWLARRSLLLTTDVAREVEWRLFSEFLELPYLQDYRGGQRRVERDALADAILSDPELSAVMRAMLQGLGRRADDPVFRDWLGDAMSVYTGSRVAASDLANALLSAGSGALFAKQWTPGALSLGPVVANVMAQHLAVASFPLGAGLGSLWYGAFPVTAPAVATISLTGGLVAVFAMVSAFSGLVTDPIQARLGLHKRRLRKLVDRLERTLLEEEAHFTLRDHYAARVFDLFDILGTAYRLTLR